MTETAAPTTTSIVGCARCLADGHEDIEFMPLTHPLLLGGIALTHWATCPTNGEPILMTFDLKIGDPWVQEAMERNEELRAKLAAEQDAGD